MAQLFLNLDILSREMLVLLHTKLQAVYPSLTTPTTSHEQDNQMTLHEEETGPQPEGNGSILFQLRAMASDIEHHHLRLTTQVEQLSVH